MRKPLLIGAALILLVSGAIVVLLIGLKPFGSQASTHNQPSVSTATAKPPTQIIHEPLPNSDVTFLQEHVNSADKTMQSLAWLPELRDAYIASVSNPLPPGTALKISAQTFWHAGEYGEVEGAVGGATYLLHLELASGQWLLAWTDKK